MEKLQRDEIKKNGTHAAAVSVLTNLMNECIAEGVDTDLCPQYSVARLTQLITNLGINKENTLEVIAGQRNQMVRCLTDFETEGRTESLYSSRTSHSDRRSRGFEGSSRLGGSINQRRELNNLLGSQ